MAMLNNQRVIHNNPIVDYQGIWWIWWFSTNGRSLTCDVVSPVFLDVDRYWTIHDRYIHVYIYIYVWYVYRYTLYVYIHMYIYIYHWLFWSVLYYAYAPWSKHGFFYNCINPITIILLCWISSWILMDFMNHWHPRSQLAPKNDRADMWLVVKKRGDMLLLSAWGTHNRVHLTITWGFGCVWK